MGLELIITIIGSSIGATWVLSTRMHSTEKSLSDRLGRIETAIVEGEGDRRVIEERIATNEELNKRELKYLRAILAKISPSCPISE